MVVRLILQVLAFTASVGAYGADEGACVLVVEQRLTPPATCTKDVIMQLKCMRGPYFQPKKLTLSYCFTLWTFPTGLAISNCRQ